MQDIDSDVIFHAVLKLTQASSRRTATWAVIKENNVIYAKVKEDWAPLLQIFSMQMYFSRQSWAQSEILKNINQAWSTVACWGYHTKHGAGSNMMQQYVKRR